MSKDVEGLKVGNNVTTLEDEVEGEVMRVFPDGCIEVYWHNSDRVRRVFKRDELKLVTP